MQEVQGVKRNGGEKQRLALQTELRSAGSMPTNAVIASIVQ
jgi:hypothetical protein